MRSNFNSPAKKVTSCFPVKKRHGGRMEVRLNGSIKAAIALILGVVITANGQAPLSSQPAMRSPAPQAGVVAPRPSGDAPSSTPITGDLDDTIRIQAGDKLSYRVDQDRDEQAKVLQVTDTGEIELPYNFGRFVAAKKTCRALAQEIKNVLEKDYYHHATVHVGLDTRNAVRGQVYVSGQVTKPGPVTMRPDSPLMLRQAIILAGPPTQWAKMSEIKIMRQIGKETKTITVDGDAIFKKGRLDQDVVLEPDDVIIVPERGVVF
jgi:protein involved in polysaccharide export with SLBB domain